MPSTEHRPPRRRTGAARAGAAAALAGLLVVLPAAAASAGTVTAPGTPPAFLRTAHLVTGLGPVDVRLTPFSAEGGPGRSGDSTARGSAYGAVDTYAPVAAESYAVTVRRSDAGPGEQPLLSGTVTLEPGRAYTVVAFGPSDSPRLHLLDDDVSPPPAGQAEVRLFSAVPRAQVALDGGAVVEQVPPAPDTGYVPVPAGDRLLEVSDGTRSTELEVGLSSRSSYTVFVRPGPGGALGVQAVLDQAGAEAVPVGGIDTGGGWLAEQETRTGGPTVVPLVGGLVAGLLAALAAVALRTRHRASLPSA